VYYRGLRLRNSEVGAAGLSASGFLFRDYCLNGLIFGLSDEFAFNIRHSKNAPARWMRELQPAIEHYAKSSGSTLQAAIERTQEAVVAQDNDEMVAWLNNRTLSRKRAREVIEAVEREEGHPCRTVWDAAQGLTALARKAHSVDDRSDLEVLAGKWMSKVADLAA
jgi:succinate dehydrogenase flavin-adding protein (antitoxin of CptAB toxin-antitoxin module)